MIPPIGIGGGGTERRLDFLDRLRSMGPKDALAVGIVREELLASWRNVVTHQVILTGERRQHYLERHPDIVEFDRFLIDLIGNPNEIHRNARDPLIAIFYLKTADRYLRAAVWVSNQEGLQNSIHSLRLARAKEVIDGRAKGRMAWNRS